MFGICMSAIRQCVLLTHDAGYTKPPLPEQFGGRKILLKPFLIDKLRDTINSILANP